MTKQVEADGIIEMLDARTAKLERLLSAIARDAKTVTGPNARRLARDVAAFRGALPHGWSTHAACTRALQDAVKA